MRFCNVPGAGDDDHGCTGHLSKFDDCLAEALFWISLDSADAEAGSHDFEVTVALIVVPEPFAAGIQGSSRRVVVPAGNYLVWTATSGAVTLTEVEDEQGARDVVANVESRHAAWERNCDLERPDLHAGCAEGQGDRCLLANESWA